MKLLTFVFGFLLCILIVLPAEGNFLDKLKGVGEKIGNVGEKIGRGFASVGKKIGLGIVKLGKPLANPLCKVINSKCFTYLVKHFLDVILPRHSLHSIIAFCPSFMHAYLVKNLADFMTCTNETTVFLLSLFIGCSNCIQNSKIVSTLKI